MYSFVLLYNYKRKSKNKGHERYVRIVQTTYDRLQDFKKKAKSWPFGMSSSGCVQILREPSIVPVNNNIPVSLSRFTLHSIYTEKFI